MKLIIDNIGKIKHTEILFNGITVLAGENNTGKSTVGKSLYCIFNSCYNIDTYIAHQKISRARREISNIIKANIHLPEEYDIEEFSEVLGFSALNYNALQNLFENPSKDQIEKLIKSSLSESVYSSIESLDSVLSAIEEKILEIKNLPKEKYYVSRVGNMFNSVFDEQFLNFDSENGTVTGEIKGKKVVASFNENTCYDLSLDFMFTNQALLLDTPSVLDDLNGVSIRPWRTFGNDVRFSLLTKLNTEKSSDTADVDTTITEHKMSRVFDLLNDVVPGKFQKSEFSQGRSFLFKGMTKPIKLKNLSQGIKSFLIIKRLCENGQFKERDVLILDEPEINLHPSWQVVYAELVVLLQKEYDLTILLSTHSPYFLSAIEGYSKKYDIVNKCTFYLSDNDENGSAFFTDVTNDTEKIYNKLARPFDIISEI